MWKWRSRSLVSENLNSLENTKFCDTFWIVPNWNNTLHQCWIYPLCCAVDLIRAAFEVALVVVFRTKPETTNFDCAAARCITFAD
jgi:hypothetical protein